MDVTAKAVIGFALAKRKAGGRNKFMKLSLDRRKKEVIEEIKYLMEDATPERRAVIAIALDIVSNPDAYNV